MPKWNRAGTQKAKERAECNHNWQLLAGRTVNVLYKPWLERFKVRCVNCGVTWYEKESIRCGMELIG